MHEWFFKTMDDLMPALRRGDLAECERHAAQVMSTFPPSPFHVAVNLAITNDPGSIALHFDDFIRRESQSMSIAALYTEMNGFSINPDRWFCDVFAYEAYGGREDYDWLSDWQSDFFDDFEINGLEPLQAVYASDAFRSDAYGDACDISSILVVVKFQRFIQVAAREMRELKFPLLATAHDYDFIAEFRPS